MIALGLRSITKAICINVPDPLRRYFRTTWTCFRASWKAQWSYQPADDTNRIVKTVAVAGPSESKLKIISDAALTPLVPRRPKHSPSCLHNTRWRLPALVNLARVVCTWCQRTHIVSAQTNTTLHINTTYISRQRSATATFTGALRL